jgi:hypothetical protein
MKRDMYLIRLLLLETECQRPPPRPLTRSIGRLKNLSFLKGETRWRKISAKSR